MTKKNDHIGYIALDMDGTILNKDYVLSAAVRDTLAACRAAGKKVIISTGRVFASANKHVAAAGGVDGFVCTNGADVYDGKGAILAQTHMDEPLSRRIVAISRAFGSHFHAFIGDRWYYEREKPYTLFYVKRSRASRAKKSISTATASSASPRPCSLTTTTGWKPSRQSWRASSAAGSRSCTRLPSCWKSSWRA